MHLFRSIAAAAPIALAAVCFASACSDNSNAPPKPAAIQIVAGDAQSAIAATALAIAPTFVVNDASGHPIANVAVTVAVTTGGGTIAGAPSKSSSGATSIGSWTLGTKTGANTAVVTVAGLPAITFGATATAGAPAKFAASTPLTIAAHAGGVVSPAPAVHVTDAFDNPVATANVTLALTGGGSAPSSIVADADGNIAIAPWQLRTTVGQNVLTLTAGAATVSFVANVSPGDPSQLLVVSGDQQIAKAGSLAAPVNVSIADKYGNAIPNQTATFSVTSGGGSLAATTEVSTTDGIIAAPAWTLGRSALPQTVHVTSGAFATDISATIQTDYTIDIRFFGPEMTDLQKSYFTNAAARISAIITNDLPDVLVLSLNIADVCGVPGLPVLNETVDDLVIYASIADIDGPGKILAEAGPCVFRSSASANLTTVGVMLFDGADMAAMATQGITQDVITHEMLHVVGVGTLWQTKGLLTGASTVDAAFRGARGVQGCIADGGAPTCASSVPVENNGVVGTADAHWRETTFGNELMTGYANAGGMPLSAITVGSLADLGYVVNPLAADPYHLPTAAIGASSSLTPIGAAANWERPLPGGLILPAKAGDAPQLIRRP